MSEFQDLSELKTVKDVAHFLKVNPKLLAITLYGSKDNRKDRYTTYKIPKKCGGDREIYAPEKNLKFIQKSLLSKLKFICKYRPSAHAYIVEKSIFTNAKPHTKKKFVLNIDLNNFFDSIHFGRVRGIFMSKPFQMHQDGATIFAQIACRDNVLPQGGVLSPLISNLVCYQLDGDFQRLARENKCTYTRYADDISISTNLKKLPVGILASQAQNVILSSEISEIIKKNKFQINPKKTFIKTSKQRQIVTGLVVNQKVNVSRMYIRSVRAALDCWMKHGIEKAMEGYNNADARKSSKRFRNSIRGKIAYIEHSRKFSLAKSKIEDSEKKKYLKPILKMIDQFHICSMRDKNMPIIRTEGKTDWMHFEIARNKLILKNEIENKNVCFYRSKDSKYYGGEGILKAFYSGSANNKWLDCMEHKIVCLFDGDVAAPKNKNVSSKVVQMSLDEGICVENLYEEAFIKTYKVAGKRLYFANEFNDSGYHKTDNNIKFSGFLKDKKSSTIIDNNVWDIQSNQLVSLSKAKFAASLFKDHEAQNQINFSKFKPVFEKIFLLI